MADLSMIFNVIARDGASPAFRTVAGEAKLLQRTLEEADAKMAAASKASAASINASMAELGKAHTGAALQYDRANATMIGADDSLEASQAKLAASMRALVVEQRAAAASAVEMGATIDGVAAETAAASEASAARRKASFMSFGAVAAAVTVGVAYEATKMAADFQQKTNVLVTAAGESAGALKSVREGVLNIATETGTKWQDLTDGLYQIEKAGYRSGDALKILRASAQGAREEGANLATVTNATTSVLASYHLGAADAVRVTNEIKTAAGESKTTMESFAGSLSTVLPLASANHVAFSDLAGVLSTMTQHGTSADEATQEIANTLRNLSAPNQVANKEFAQLSGTSELLSSQLGKRGLTGTMDYLSQLVLEKMGPAGTVLLNTFNQSKVAAADAQTEFNALPPAVKQIAQSFEDGQIGVKDYRTQVRNLGGEQGALGLQFLQTYTNAHGFQDAIKAGSPAAQTYSDAIKKLTGGANGLNTVLQSTGGNLAGNEERAKRVADAFNQGGKDVSGWASTQKLFNVQMDRFKQSIDALLIRLGTHLLPVVTAVFGFLADHTGAVAALAGIIGGVLLSATIAWTIALQANPIVLITEAVIALAVGWIVLITHWKEFVAFLHGPWGTAISYAIGAIAPFIGIPLLIIGHWGEISRFFERMWHDVSVWFFDGWHAVDTATRDVIGAAEAVGRFFERMWHDVAGFTARMWNDVAGFFARIYRDVTGFAVRIWRDVAGFFQRMWHDVADFTSRMWNDVAGFFARIYRDVTSAIGSAVDFVSRHWRLLLALFAGPLGFIIDVIYRFRQSIVGAFESMWRAVATIVGNFWHAVTRDFAALWRDIAGFSARIWHDVVGFFSRMWHDVAGFTARMWHDSAGFAARMWHDVADFTSRMWHDVANFVARMWHDVSSFFGRMWNDVAGFAARIWRDVTGWVSRMWHDVANFVSRMWRDVTGWFARMWHDVAGFVTNLWRDVTGWFSRMWHDLTDFAVRTFHDVSKPFQDLWAGLKLGFADAVGAIDATWHRLQEIFAAPIRFLVHYVYDDAIVPVWNAVAGIVGEKSLAIKPYNFATGGVVPGNHNRDTVPLYGTPGEVMVPKPVVAKFGGPHALMSMLGFKGGDGRGGHYSLGGIVHGLTHNPITDTVGDAAKGLVQGAKAVGTDIAHPSQIIPDLTHLVRGALSDVAAPAINGAVSLFKRLVGTGSGEWGKASGDVGQKIADGILTWIRGQDARDQAAMAANAGGELIDYNGGPNTIGLIEHLALTLGVKPVPPFSTFRAGDGYHGVSEAVDFSDGFGNTPTMLNFDKAWAKKYGGSLAELIHNAPGSVNIKDGKIVDGLGFYGPGTYNAHRNHVHVAISPASIAAGRQALDSLRFGGGANIVAGGSLQLRAAAQQLLDLNGWGGQFGALSNIISRESGWDVHATNPSSGAYGIPQALPAGKMASAGGDWRDNGVTQLRWMLGYIRATYGDPNGAWGFWQQHHAYANGGTPPTGVPFLVGENGPELLRLGSQAGGSRIHSNRETRQIMGADDQLTKALLDVLRRLPANIGAAVVDGMDSTAKGARLRNRAYSGQF